MGATLIRPNDTLVIYGRVSAVQEIDRRKAGPAGDEEHRLAVDEQQVIEAAETTATG